MIRAGLALLILLTAGSICEAAAMKIERVTSASGIEAWLVRDHSIPVVTLRFTFVGGASLDPSGKDGTAALAASLLDEGAGEYDTTAFHRRLDELAAEMSFSAGHDEFDGTLRMLKSNSGRERGAAARRPDQAAFRRRGGRAHPCRDAGRAGETGPQPALAVGPAVDGRGIRTASLRQEYRRQHGRASRRSRAPIWPRSRRASSSATRS